MCLNATLKQICTLTQHLNTLLTRLYSNSKRFLIGWSNSETNRTIADV